MFTRIAALTGALLLASGPVMASSNPVLQWNGDISKSCALTADQVGKVVLNGKQGAASRLDSTESGGRPAILGYTVIGGTASIGFTNTEVTRDGVSILSNTDHLVEIRYEGRNNWVKTWQNGQQNTVNNQQRLSKDAGNGTIDVEARTDAHLAQDNSIITGAYVVKTTMSCNI